MWIGVQTEEGELWGETEDWTGERGVMSCGCSHTSFRWCDQKKKTTYPVTFTNQQCPVLVLNQGRQVTPPTW